MDSYPAKLPLEVVSLILGHFNTRNDYYQGTLISKHFYKSMVLKLWQTPMKLKSAEYASTPASLLAKSLVLDRTSLHPLRSTLLGDFVRKIRFNESTLVDTMMLCLSHMPLLESLHIKDVLGVVDETMDHITLICPNIKVFNLTCHEITDQTLVYLGRNGRQLHALCLSECHLLTPNALSPVKESGLKKLDLYECDWVNAIRTAMDIRHMDQLTHLRFEECPGIDSDFIRRLLRKKTTPTGNSSDPSSLIPLPYLKELSINEYFNQVPIDGLVLASFAKAHPELDTLVVTLYNINDATLSALSSALPSIFSLYLQGPCQVSSQAVRNLIKACPILCDLVLQKCRLPARCFPEVASLYNTRNHAFSLANADLCLIRNNTQANFTAEDDELHTSDEEEGWHLHMEFDQGQDEEQD